MLLLSFLPLCLQLSCVRYASPRLISSPTEMISFWCENMFINVWLTLSDADHVSCTILRTENKKTVDSRTDISDVKH